MHPLETYLNDLRDTHRTGSAVKETSYYPALSQLLNEVGKTLKPKVRCVVNIRNQGAGIPDGGLFTASQIQRTTGTPAEGTAPERGCVEVKGTSADVNVVAASAQVKKYLQHYGQVLVTNYRDFVLVGIDAAGEQKNLERYSLAANEAEFWTQTAEHARQTATAQGERFVEYLRRVMLTPAPLTSPEELARFLASYARDARARLEGAELPALASVRGALEEALGLKFEGAEGEHFFRSTLVQTLFYGIFSAWVLWDKQNSRTGEHRAQFDWRTATYLLRVPMIKSLFHRIADPQTLQQFNLVEVLDWTAATLNRVERAEFFQRFEETQAVQYFYEPFLQEFDPTLRKQLGVWYTPREIVRYMVERVDTVLREELGIADGLADERVYVLDPCCGTGAYLVEVLRRIGETLRERGQEGFAAHELKQAAMNRVFGFEILPAPFVVAHLQLGLLLQSLDAPLGVKDGKEERAGVYLTNALTGWEPPSEAVKERLKQLAFTFAELKEERDAAELVKREKPILVILGNPPYNAFAGTSPEEEQGLVEPYKAGLISDWGIKKFNLDDLYVRFFRLAERRVARELSGAVGGEGVVCYISNFSYLRDPSFVVMRQRFLKEFDALWFDSLNGDSRETGKLTPEGKPDPSVFSTDYNREGIRVGTAIGLMVRKQKRDAQPVVRYREFWGVTKRADLLESLEAKDINGGYTIVEANEDDRFSFRTSDVTAEYKQWPKLAELCDSRPLQGMDEDRAFDLIDIDKKKLSHRIKLFLDPTADFDSVKKIAPGLTRDSARYVAQKARERLIQTEPFSEEQIARYHLRPLDVRWCYYTSVRPIWKEPRPSLLQQNWRGNSFLVSRPSSVASPEGVPFLFVKDLIARDAMRGHAIAFPIRVRDKQTKQTDDQNTLFGYNETFNEEATANLSPAARAYLASLGIADADADEETAALVWMHALAIGYSPAYLAENADGIRGDWPRIPLPATFEALRASAALGRQIAQLLDTEAAVAGVTSGKLDAALRTVANFTPIAGGQPRNLEDELKITAGWGHAGQNGVTMPGRGKLNARDYTADELDLISQTASARGLSLELAQERLGQTTNDVSLNDVAYWRNVPARVWDYHIGGYQVIKKWLSYREHELLKRSLSVEEAREVTNMARRIAAILLLEPALDENYRAVKMNAHVWGAGRQD